MKKQVKVLLGFLCFFFVCVFAFSAFKMFGIIRDYDEASGQHSDLRNQYVSEGVQNNAAYQQGGQPAASENSPITVDFASLLQQNGDVEGWLYCADTVINYVVAKGEDNDKYLRSFLDGSYNTGGTLFVDWMCGDDFSGKNTIIYGHNMRDGSMFATLLKYDNQEFFDAHPYMYLNTPSQDYRIDIFAGFVTDASSDVYTIGFTSDEYFAQHVEKMRSMSNFRSGVEVSPEDRIVTLSTCSYVYDDARYVVIGKLVPIGGGLRPAAPTPAG